MNVSYNNRNLHLKRTLNNNTKKILSKSQQTPSLFPQGEAFAGREKRINLLNVSFYA